MFRRSLQYEESHWRVLRSVNRSPVFVLLFIVVVAILIVSCGSIEQDYKYFHWFVDGIPEPGSPEALGQTDQTGLSSFVAGNAATLATVTTYYSHKPWADENCQACHRGASSFGMPSRDDSGVCMNCHQEVVDEYRYMHGAVVSIACLWCHAPHVSQYEDLLRAESPVICLQCHSTEGGNLVAEGVHADLTRDCLECHFGHGSEEAGFLRPSFPSVQPEEIGPPPSPPAESGTGAVKDEESS